MTNEEKARELSKKFARQYHANNWPEWSDDEAFHYSNEEINNACLEMAQWKDEQFEKIWHTKDEEPQFKEEKDFVDQESRVIVCVEGLAFSTHIVIDIYDWNLQYRNNVRFWAYIEDVLPKKFIQ